MIILRGKKSLVSRYYIKFDFLFEGEKVISLNSINICYLLVGRYVLEEIVFEVFNIFCGCR